jgi:Na+/H+ antiporter NhaD/arsenite permease-like protein
MKTLYHNFIYFIKTEIVLFISALAALLTMFFVPPSIDYIDYLDLRVLSLLFCLMIVVAGLNETGIFLLLSKRLLHKINNTRSLYFLLVLLSFFSSMFITNDVALITFVPFAIMILNMTGLSKHLIPVIVLQTIAANLGSMLTPIGNPQNLYLYTYYDISLYEFFKITCPYTAISFILLCGMILLLRKEPLPTSFAEDNKTDEKKTYTVALYCVLFIVCLLCVMRMIDYRITLFFVIISVLIFERKILRKVDYCLLLTFLSFFVFVGNLGNIPEIKDFLMHLLFNKELPISIAASQIISNVPAAVLLSAFTKDYRALILGTDIGGLGTIVASLASLISFKFYCKTKDSQPGKFLGLFTLYNILFLIILCSYYYISFHFVFNVIVNVN